MILQLAILLLAATISGFLATKFKQASVLGMIIIGIILGPGVLGIITESPFLTEISNIGVLLLMFMAGLETDIQLLKKTKVASVLVGLMGIILPLCFGFLVGLLFGFPTDTSFFIGLLLSATSVSVSVQVLKELGKLNTRIGAVTLGAAVIDDIVVILTLTFFLSFTTGDVSLSAVVLKKVIFFGAIGLFSWKVTPALFNYISKKFNAQTLLSAAFVLCLIFSYFAEAMGVAGIIGAFIAGLTLSFYPFKESLLHKTELFGNTLFVPVFFVSVGFAVSFVGLSDKVVFITVISVVAIVTKWLGSFAGAKMAKLPSNEAHAIGVGMVSRGEVALILLAMGMEEALLDQVYYSSFVIMIVVTTIFTPVVLRQLLVGKEKKN